MTKGDYIKLARGIYAAGEKIYQPDLHMWGKMIIVIADICQSDNPNFDRNKFKEACLHGK